MELRPNLVAGWFYLGEALSRPDRGETAVEAYGRALEIDPTHSRSSLALGRALASLGRRGEALRTLRHGTPAARGPAAMSAALSEVSSETAGAP